MFNPEPQIFKELHVSPGLNTFNQEKLFSFVLDMKVTRCMGSQGKALYNHERQNPTILSVTVRSTSYVYRQFQPDGQIDIHVVPQQEAKYGNIPSEQAQLLMIIRKRNMKKHEDNSPEGSLFRHNQDCFVLEPQSKLISQQQYGYSKFDRSVYECIRRKNQDGYWHVHRIKKDDILKFGTHLLKVVQVESQFLTQRKTKQTKSEFKTPQIDQNQADFIEKSAKQIRCKICLSGCIDSLYSGPLISPCKCKGSCQFIHLKCLQTWILSKAEKKEFRQVTAHTMHKFSCEICKQLYPLNMDLSQKIYRDVESNDLGAPLPATEHQYYSLVPLVEYEIPSSPYLVLQRIYPIQRKRVFVVRSCENDRIRGSSEISQINIGRTNANKYQNQIVLHDPTVSRKHAYIQFDSELKEFYLIDSSSLHGTLLLLEPPSTCQEWGVNKQKIVTNFMKVQVGDTIFSFQINRENIDVIENHNNYESDEFWVQQQQQCNKQEKNDQCWAQDKFQHQNNFQAREIEQDNEQKNIIQFQLKNSRQTQRVLLLNMQKKISKDQTSQNKFLVRKCSNFSLMNKKGIFKNLDDQNKGKRKKQSEELQISQLSIKIDENKNIIKNRRDQLIRFFENNQKKSIGDNHCQYHRQFPQLTEKVQQEKYEKQQEEIQELKGFLQEYGSQQIKFSPSHHRNRKDYEKQFFLRNAHIDYEKQLSLIQQLSANQEQEDSSYHFKNSFNLNNHYPSVKQQQEKLKEKKKEKKIEQLFDENKQLEIMSKFLQEQQPSEQPQSVPSQFYQKNNNYFQQPESSRRYYLNPQKQQEELSQFQPSVYHDDQYRNKNIGRFCYEISFESRYS